MHPGNCTLSVYLADEQATLNLGALLALAVQGGLSIWLEGDLGAGKTTLTRGLLRGLGHQGRVKSPTYTLVEPYVFSNLELHHFDLYRFSDPHEWLDAGFRELFHAHSVCIVEWPDKAAGFLPPADWHCCLRPQGDGRCFELNAATELGKTCLAILTALDQTPPAA